MLRNYFTKWPQESTNGVFCGGLNRAMQGRTFHCHAGRGVYAALGIAHTAQVTTGVLLAHALDTQPLIGVCQVDSCKR